MLHSRLLLPSSKKHKYTDFFEMQTLGNGDTFLKKQSAFVTINWISANTALENPVPNT